MWYQTGPYWAYYYSGRYQDVIDLATKTLENMSEPILEESYYWRALAREAVGDVDGAIEDLQDSLEYHTGFEPSLALLQRLGVSAPPSQECGLSPRYISVLLAESSISTSNAFKI